MHSLSIATQNSIASIIKVENMIKSTAYMYEHGVFGCLLVMILLLFTSLFVTCDDYICGFY